MSLFGAAADIHPCNLNITAYGIDATGFTFK
jgi:hypothetical protein